ncbi:nucleotide sugar dehydrogenase [Subtercola endophyticus]|uniref:nucleotide sugar dehydrogenase n=1 Tax=Subtercola endophyticus TaxID=2895559 RepID=UPI001E3801FB|nr:nucleotide sugar dehydrogenase [Subtercola endophyticus]UFS60248.1 nucleotide sugar dehydrogenase [Subtercola endophyticus]
MSSITGIRHDSSEEFDEAPSATVVPIDRAGREPAFDFDVAIVGLGYVGLPTAISYAIAGVRVLGLEISTRRLETIIDGQADLLDRDQARLAEALSGGGLTLTNDHAELATARAVVVCVPTPVDDFLIPDLSILRAACAMVVDSARAGQTLMLTSTTYVGCTDDLLVKPLAERRLEAGRDIFVAFSAERIDPGSASFEQRDVPRVVGGATPECEEEADRLLHLYAANVHHVGSLAAAEMTKLLENTFRAVNIALANEFADICSSLDLDINVVIDAAATKPYGFMAFRPGPGVGGHCIPCDPHYLLWQLRKSRVDAPLIEVAMSAIAHRPKHVVERVRDVLSDRGTGLAGARVLVVGIAYKPNVADLRESPALEILAELREHGASVGYLDDHFDLIALSDGHILQNVVQPSSFDPDLIIMHTSHAGVDLEWITTDQLVIDATYDHVAYPQAVNL